MQHLRKRQIVIVGSGLGAIAFCRAFRSRYAEITLITQESNFTPQVVLNAIAAGKLNPATYTRSLRVMFSKRKDIRILNQTILTIDPEKRQIVCDESDEPVSYDYLLFGNESKDGGTAVHDYSSAMRLRDSLQDKGKLDTLAVIGPGTPAIELATAFADLARKVMLISSHDTLFLEAETPAERKISAEIRKTGVHLFTVEELDILEGTRLTLGRQTMDCDMVIDQRESTIPVCAKALGLEEIRKGILKTRPDFSIPQQPRLYTFADHCEIQDGLGKKLPELDRVTIHQARYLSRILKGKIEAVKGYDIDCPGFIYKGAGDFARLHATSSVGKLGKYPVVGLIGMLIDTLLHKLPTFRIAYGGFGTWFQFSGHLK